MVSVFDPSRSASKHASCCAWLGRAISLRLAIAVKPAYSVSSR